MYEQHLTCFWTVDEIDLCQDIEDWNKLNGDWQHFIRHIFAFDFPALDFFG